MRSGVVGSEGKNCETPLAERMVMLGRMQWGLSCLANCVTTRLENLAEFLPHLRGEWIFLLREVFCEMVTDSGVTRKPFCAIPSDACAAFLRYCLLHNHL